MNVSYFLRQVKKADRDLSAEKARRENAANAVRKWFSENIENNYLQFDNQGKDIRIRRFDDGEVQLTIDQVTVLRIATDDEILACNDTGEAILEYFADELEQA